MRLAAAFIGCLMAACAQAQDVKTAEQLLAELGTPSGGSLLASKRFSANYRPDATTGRCGGGEQGSGLARKDLAVVPLSGEEPVRARVPFLFEFDKHLLTPRDQHQADELARALNSAALGGRRFSISGHTDAAGPVEHNRRLSCARALSVRDALVQRGVDARRLGAFGFGSDRLDDTANPASARNRRVMVENVDAFNP